RVHLGGQHRRDHHVIEVTVFDVGRIVPALHTQLQARTFGVAPSFRRDRGLDLPVLVHAVQQLVAALHVSVAPGSETCGMNTVGQVHVLPVAETELGPHTPYHLDSG